MIKRLMMVMVGVLGLVLVGCSSPEEAEGSPLCDALGAPVAGIDEIGWENGLTREEATWAALLDSGILQADEASRRAAAAAVAAAAVESDTEGFAEVLDAASSSLRPRLERLREVVLDPDAVVDARSDEAVTAAIEAVRAATPPEICGWAR